MKYCPKCRETKPLESFHLARGRNDGRSGWCASCKNTGMRKSRTRKTEKEKYYKDRKKKTMRSMTGRLVRTGRIRRRPCKVCGAEKAQVHHISYLNPYDIDWLCKLHHAEEHHGDKPECSMSNNRGTTVYPDGYCAYKKNPKYQLDEAK